jgi:hypothetical protein
MMTLLRILRWIFTGRPQVKVLHAQCGEALRTNDEAFAEVQFALSSNNRQIVDSIAASQIATENSYKAQDQIRAVAEYLGLEIVSDGSGEYVVTAAHDKAERDAAVSTVAERYYAGRSHALLRELLVLEQRLADERERKAKL